MQDNTALKVSSFQITLTAWKNLNTVGQYFYVTAPFKQSLHVHGYTSCNAVRLDVLLNYPLSQTDAV